MFPMELTATIKMSLYQLASIKIADDMIILLCSPILLTLLLLIILFVKEMCFDKFTMFFASIAETLHHPRIHLGAR